MKRVIIIGANGRSARELIPLLSAKHDVSLTLFARDRNQLQDISSETARVIEGNALDPIALTSAIAGQDIVIVALGGNDLAEATAAVVDASLSAAASRIITINGAGIYDELPEPFLTWNREQVGWYQPTSRRAADVIEQSTLTYTILRPTWLTDKPTTEIEITRRGETFEGTETSRASVAHLIASIVDAPEMYVNENLGIAQPGTAGEKPSWFQ